MFLSFEGKVTFGSHPFSWIIREKRPIVLHLLGIKWFCMTSRHHTPWSKFQEEACVKRQSKIKSKKKISCMISNYKFGVLFSPLLPGIQHRKFYISGAILFLRFSCQLKAAFEAGHLAMTENRFFFLLWVSGSIWKNPTQVDVDHKLPRGQTMLHWEKKKKETCKDKRKHWNTMCFE